MRSRTTNLLLVLSSIFLPTVLCSSQVGRCGQCLLERIIRGTTVQRGEYPWMAALVPANNPSFIECGAALISRKYAVTALHCTKEEPSQFNLLLGTTELKKIDSKSVIAKIQAFIKYVPDQGSKDADIALIKLKSNVRLTDFIQPICLPPPNQDFSFVQAVVAGYGETNPKYEQTGESIYSDVLLEGDVNTTSTSYCNKVMARYNRPIDDTLLCAGSYHNQPDHCYGDSGGPLMYLNEELGIWQLIGVVSSAYKCANVNDYSYYVNVTKFTNWIILNSDYIG